jgi:ABC-type enterochelin transport system permease subunit
MEERRERLNRKMAVLVLGAVLIVISLVLGGVQDLHVHSIYGASSNKWYFYGAIGIMLILGIILAAWALLRKEAPKQTKP